MSTDKNNPLSSNPSHKCCGSALQLGPRKKAVSLNPLVLHGVLQLKESESQSSLIEDYPADIWREHRVFMELLDSYPGLLDHLTSGKEEDIIHIGKLLGKWVSGIGQVIIPPLSRNIQSDQGFNHEATGVLLCPAGLDWSDVETKEGLKSGETAVRGDQWPIFLYADHIYDPEDP
ncbi:hypothetical protein CY34DRAFT_19430 [Suillus luteus UH-Slu-Lm8-n1]|uniref:Uncharacterized protein n=1 Tax=Suillus luteus UH-Slu-Lm8-n1 TaxID=930992 RepID=A0A0D0A1B2_9AGAM|nr:hypothetical protein CY34DRAFT_19430 [Suillus luteus UH-Slu-Lm8-n1]